jgi:hypothetical protein
MPWPPKSAPHRASATGWHRARCIWLWHYTIGCLEWRRSFAQGTISARLASTIVWHTDLIKDAETLQLVDETLAQDAARFGPLSATKTAPAINTVVDYYDPGALRRTHDAVRRPKRPSGWQQPTSSFRASKVYFARP